MHQKKLLLIKKYDMREKQQSWLFLIYVKWRIAYTQDDLFQFICIHSNSTYTSATHAAYIQYSIHTQHQHLKATALAASFTVLAFTATPYKNYNIRSFFYDFDSLQIKVLKASI